MWIRTNDSLFSSARVNDFSVIQHHESDDLVTYKQSKDKAKYVPVALIWNKYIWLVEKPLATEADAQKVIDEIQQALVAGHSHHDMRWRNECRERSTQSPQELCL
jgi:hypothetical protein